MSSNKIIIIPDLHGREFWRGAVKNMDEETRVVFLGDYLDPYEDDWVYWCDAFKAFKDIIALKEAYPEQITLLLGNHDLHYLFPSLRGSRYNEYQEEKTRRELETHLGGFQMAVEYKLEGKRYLFSHAGIHSDWARKHSSLFGPFEKISAETFNQMMFMPEFVNALSDISWRRGGSATSGSMVWADIYEYELSTPIAPEVIQICGHTRLPEGEPNRHTLILLLIPRQKVLINFWRREIQISRKKMMRS